MNQFHQTYTNLFSFVKKPASSFFLLRRIILRFAFFGASSESDPINNFGLSLSFYLWLLWLWEIWWRVSIL